MKSFIALVVTCCTLWSEADAVNLKGYFDKEAKLCDTTVKQDYGYIDLDTGDKHYFYWFFEARKSPEKAPLILWLNGGPGCSSELGLFTENGPCSVLPDGKSTKINTHSWNNNANLIFVDQPAGTGFSYGSGFDHDEEMVGNDFYDFLELFFQKNEYLRGKDFFITGESYGGHYVPAIGHKIFKENAKLKKTDKKYIHLKGIAIGNGMVDAQIQYQYYPEMIISSNHHKPLVSEFTYMMMKAAVKPCVSLIAMCEQRMPASCLAAVETCNAAMMLPYSAKGMNPYDMRLKCQKPPLCNDYDFLVKYLNNATVHQILGIPDGLDWATCNTNVNLMFTTDGDGIRTVSPLIADLLDNSDIEVVVYAGDQDYICNWLGNQAWVNQLNWRNKEKFASMELKPWKVEGKEVGTIKTLDGFTFVRVYDAGHMVPQDQPIAATHIIEDLVMKKSKLLETTEVFGTVNA